MSGVPIQIVDTNDRPIKAASKQEAWEQGLFHRVVRIMLEGPDGRLLLQHRSPTKDLFPNTWDNSCAGHVDAGEDYETAITRELQEELGLTGVRFTEAGRYFWASEWKGYKTRRFLVFYKGKLNALPTRLEEGKIDDARWFTLDEIKQLIKEHPEQVSDGLREVIQLYYTPVAPGQHEPVVIADDQDNEISNASLDMAREFGLIFRTVFVAARNSRGQVLLQKRSPNLRIFPGCWDASAAGHVDGGRSYEQAAQQELKEEIGVEGLQLREVAHFLDDTPVPGEGPTRRYAKLFVAELEDTPQKLGRDEVAEVRWFTPEEIKQLVAEHPEQVADGLRYIHDHYLSQSA